MRGTKQKCIDCHFFVKYFNTPSGIQVTNVSQDDRNNMRQGEINRDFGLRCDFGVWDAGFKFGRSKIQQILLEKDREDFCFFWKYRPKMLTPAAKILQERESTNIEISRDRKLTTVGLWIAAFALVVNVILRILEKIFPP